ncbi:MAG: hypothetical protein AVO39_10150 [delta proteobacterium MLS_D]|nr:MAG: hypothetical protein AVO39_10150 [delta proteobacterium MLS_D]
MDDIVVYGRGGNLDNYNHDENVAGMKACIEKHYTAATEYAIEMGERLLRAREHVNHGEWGKMLDDIGFTQSNAYKMMKIARVFGDNPSLLADMTRRKAYMLTMLPNDNLMQLKNDQVVMTSDGDIYTMEDIIKMSDPELQEKIKRLEKEVRAKENELREERFEKQAAIKQAQEEREYNKKLERDKDSAMAEKFENLEKSIRDYLDELVEFRGKMAEEERIQVEGADAFNAITRAVGDFVGGVTTLNTIRLTKDYDPRLRAAFYGAITEAREWLKQAEERAYGYFGPNIEVREEDVYRDPDDEEDQA